MLSGDNTHSILTEYGCSQNLPDTYMLRPWQNIPTTGCFCPDRLLRVTIPRLGVIPDHTCSRGAGGVHGRIHVLICVCVWGSPAGPDACKKLQQAELEDDLEFQKDSRGPRTVHKVSPAQKTALTCPWGAYCTYQVPCMCFTQGIALHPPNDPVGIILSSQMKKQACGV